MSKIAQQTERMPHEDRAQVCPESRMLHDNDIDSVSGGACQRLPFGPYICGPIDDSPKVA
jgi:hypothetical protein